MRIVQAKDKICLGRRGENRATQIQFPIAEYFSDFDSGTYRLLAHRPTEDTPYPVAITNDDTYIYWDVTSADVGIEGYGYAELQLVIDELLAKSIKFVTEILDALETEGDPPEPQQGWIQQVYDTVDQKIAAGEASLNGIISEADAALNAKVTAAQQAVSNAQGYANTAGDAADAASQSAEAAQEAAQTAQDEVQKFSVTVDGNTMVITANSVK